MFPPTGALGRWELGARSGAGYPMIGATPLDANFTTSQVGFVNRQNGLRAATYTLASGIDLPVVQKILGHSQISTTQVYAKVLEEQVHEQMKKFKLDL